MFRFSLWQFLFFKSIQKCKKYKIDWRRTIFSAVFLQCQKRISIIMSKSLSKNLSNKNKHWCFCCLQDKTWIKMPILWKHRVCCFHYWDSFDRNNWPSIFDVQKDSTNIALFRVEIWFLLTNQRTWLMSQYKFLIKWNLGSLPISLSLELNCTCTLWLILKS